MCNTIMSPLRVFLSHISVFSGVYTCVLCNTKLSKTDGPTPPPPFKILKKKNDNLNPLYIYIYIHVYIYHFLLYLKTHLK